MHTICRRGKIKQPQYRCRYKHDPRNGDKTMEVTQNERKAKNEKNERTNGVAWTKVGCGGKIRRCIPTFRSQKRRASRERQARERHERQGGARDEDEKDVHDGLQSKDEGKRGLERTEKEVGEKEGGKGMDRKTSPGWIGTCST